MFLSKLEIAPELLAVKEKIEKAISDSNVPAALFSNASAKKHYAILYTIYYMMRNPDHTGNELIEKACRFSGLNRSTAGWITSDVRYHNTLWTRKTNPGRRNGYMYSPVENVRNAFKDITSKDLSLYQYYYVLYAAELELKVAYDNYHENNLTYGSFYEIEGSYNRLEDCFYTFLGVNIHFAAKDIIVNTFEAAVEKILELFENEMSVLVKCNGKHRASFLELSFKFLEFDNSFVNFASDMRYKYTKIS